MITRNVLYFIFCPLPFDMSLVVNQMSLVSLLYCLLLIMCLYSCIRLTLSFLFTRLNNPNSRSLYIAQILQSFNHGISVDSFQYVYHFLGLGRTALYSIRDSLAFNRRKQSLPLTCWQSSSHIKLGHCWMPLPAYS